MAGMGGRLFPAVLVACSMLGLLPGAPVQAQESRALLAGMKTAPLPGGGGVSRGKLPGCEVFLVSDGQSARPACVILRPGAEKAAAEGQQADALQALAERFLQAYQLRGYSVAEAGDGGAVFLFREDTARRWSFPGQQAFRALADARSLGPAISWLNDCCGGVPRSLRGSQLLWQKKVVVGSSSREMEVSLDLLQGAPCCVDIRLSPVALAKVDELVSEHLKLELEAVTGDRGSALRRRLGVRPLGFMADPSVKKVKGLPPGICLVRGGGENGLYHLAETGTLQRLRERGRGNHTPAMPDVKEQSWPQKASSKSPRKTAPEDPGKEAASAPAQPAATPAPAPGGDTTPPALTPEEARKAYAGKLRSM